MVVGCRPFAHLQLWAHPLTKHISSSTACSSRSTYVPLHIDDHMVWSHCCILWAWHHVSQILLCADALRCLHKAIGYYTDMGRLGMAARNLRVSKPVQYTAVLLPRNPAVQAYCPHMQSLWPVAWFINRLLYGHTLRSASANQWCILLYNRLLSGCHWIQVCNCMSWVRACTVRSLLCMHLNLYFSCSFCHWAYYCQQVIVQRFATPHQAGNFVGLSAVNILLLQFQLCCYNFSCVCYAGCGRDTREGWAQGRVY